MHFSHINDGSGSKFTKIAAVAGLHVVLAIGLIHTMNARVISVPKLPDLVTVFMPEAPKPPPEPPKPMPKVAPPDVVVPKVEVDVAPPPVEQPVQATTVADPTPATPGPAQPEAPAAPASANTGVMHTAVLADASGCAKPDYPARAARNGESGTVTLALLVGTDGRVAGSRVQKSSGSHDLDKAAVAALSMCKFKPATSGGVAEQAWAQIAYVWSLDQ